MAPSRVGLAEDGIAHLPLGRAELDLLAEGAGAKLAGLLRPGDAVVTAAAIAPCKNTAMLLDNMRIVQTLVQGLSAVPVAHVVNISSDAIYADGPVPLTEETPAAPTSLHGVMHLAREIALRAEVRAPIAMLRPTLIYGAADPHNGYGPNRFRRLAAAGQEIVLFGEGEERRDHVAVGGRCRDRAARAQAPQPRRSQYRERRGALIPGRCRYDGGAGARQDWRSSRRRAPARCRTTATARSMLPPPRRRFQTSIIRRCARACAVPRRGRNRLTHAAASSTRLLQFLPPCARFPARDPRGFAE